MQTLEYDRMLRELQPAAEKRLRRKHSGLRKEDRDEVIQDAMIHLVRLIEAGCPPHETQGALFTILDRRAADKARRNKTRAAVETPTGTATDLAVLSDGRGMSIEDNLFASDFNDALRKLPYATATAFILMHVRGLTRYEAAQVMQTSPSTAANLAEQGRQRLRKELP